MDQKSGLDLSKEKNRSVCSASIIWGNNHHLHLRLHFKKTPSTKEQNKDLTKTQKYIQICIKQRVWCKDLINS